MFDMYRNQGHRTDLQIFNKLRFVNFYFVFIVSESGIPFGNFDLLLDLVRRKPQGGMGMGKYVLTSLKGDQL